jgi:hypothetical protein
MAQGAKPTFSFLILLLKFCNAGRSILTFCLGLMEKLKWDMEHVLLVLSSFQCNNGYKLLLGGLLRTIISSTDLHRGAKMHDKGLGC